MKSTLKQLVTKYLALMNYMDQRKAEEKAQDIADGDDSEEEQQQRYFLMKTWRG